MLPIGILMREHRIIERLMPPIRKAVEAGRREGRIDHRFVDQTLDVLKVYADRCHHGKEEDVLFAALEGKPLTGAHRALMTELREEHRLGRLKVRELDGALRAHAEGDGAALTVILDRLEFLASFYPRHILKEDREFFFPAMAYLDDAEKTGMIERERDFDRRIIHDLYKDKVAAIDR